MNKKDRVLILGASGMVGRAITSCLRRNDYTNLLTPTRSELNLLSQTEVNDYIGKYNPNFVILAAAKVGGIADNYSYPADYIFENISIEHNVFGACHHHNIDRIFFIGSSCIYPKNCPQPIKEEYLLTGELEPTNAAFAIAKIAGLKMAESFSYQYGRRYHTLMPTSMYGEYDNFDPKTGHVIAGLISKIHSAKKNSSDTLEIWGTGTTRREFLYVEDMAEACVFLMNYDDELPPLINIGTGKDISINDLAHKIMDLMDVRLKLLHNTNNPDGTMRKVLDISKITRLGWSPKTSLEDGLKKTINYYIGNLSSV